MQSNILKTSYIQREPSDVFQTLQQSSAEVSKEKIAQGMKETDPGVFASVLTESVQKKQRILISKQRFHQTEM